MTVLSHRIITTLVATGLFVFLSLHSLNAQSGQVTDTDETLWPRIEAQLDQSASDTAFFFILQLVRGHCNRDLDCLHHTYDVVMKKLEGRFNLPGAIYVGEEMARMARQQGNLDAEASAHIDLSRFYHAMNDRRLTVMHIDEAIRLGGQAQNQHIVIRAKFFQLQCSLYDRETEEILPEMEVLLSKAIDNRDTNNVIYLHSYILSAAYSAGQYDRMETHVAALEKMPLSDPIQPTEYGMAINRAIGRADLLKMKKKWVEALHFSQQALRLCEAQPNPWREIYTLHNIAEVEWELGNSTFAKIYLSKAFTKAENLESNELLITNYTLQAKIAEAEKRYSDALEYIKKKQFYEEKHRNKSARFNIQSHYLQLEKEQLEAQKKNQDLQLNLKNTQLRFSLLVGILILLLATGVFIAYRKQREDKRKLSEQYTLIQQQSEQLKSLDASKSRFFANVSHELRTPLSLMLGPVGTLLKENQLTDKQANLLQLTHQSGKQLEQLVTDILDLGKLEMGKMELDEKPTKLTAFFRRCFAQFESLAESRQIDFSFDIAATNDATAKLDQGKCRQILNNLLSNAFKFTPAGGRVEAKLTLDNDTLHLSVADTGPGIHSDDLPHLFDRYFQTTRPDKPAEGGTGIGLALCQQNVQQFGGKIGVESTLGKGSVFQVTFPVKLTDRDCEILVSPIPQGELYSETSVSPAVLAIGEIGVSPHTTKPTILVVEDNPDLQAYIRLILEEKYQVLTAENGQVALDILGRPVIPLSVDKESTLPRVNPTSAPSPKGEGRRDVVPLLPSPLGEGPGVGLILSDLMMPVMDGHQLLEKLKSDDATRHIPVIMLTARADVRDKLQALRIGVDDYLLKPFDEEELLARIENLLKNQAARRTAAIDEPEPESAASLMSQPDREWLETFEMYVQKHYPDDTLSVSALARVFAMSESTLLRQLKRLTGLTPIQYLQEVRLDEARRLLENRRYNSITQVASKVGYDDVRSFSRSFRARFGKLPSEIPGD